MMARLLALLGLIFVGALQAEEPLRFGLISTESVSQKREQWQPLFDALAKRLGRPVVGFFATDYAGIIEAMRFNQVQAAWLGNKAAMEAVDRAGVEVFAQQVSLGGEEGYRSLLIVPANSRLGSLDDVIRQAPGLIAGIGDPNSTSGFLVPFCLALGPRGLDPRSGFKAARVSNHEGNLLAIAAGQVDVATNNTEDFGRFRGRFPERAAKIRVVWESPLIPKDPLVRRKDMADDLKQALSRFFLDYARVGSDVEQERRVLAKMLLAGFRPSDDRQLLFTRRLEVTRARLTASMDPALDPAQRAARLADAERKLKELGE